MKLVIILCIRIIHRFINIHRKDLHPEENLKMTLRRFLFNSYIFIDRFRNFLTFDKSYFHIAIIHNSCRVMPVFFLFLHSRCNVAAKALIYYLLPLLVIAFFYILMARRLQASARELPGALHGTQSAAQARARRHVARMVLAFVIGIYFCYIIS